MRKLRTFTPDEDTPLLLSWHRGDLSAFENLVWKYLKRVFNLAFYLTGNHESASAATQAAFVAAFTNINSFSSRFHFSTWLLTLTLKETRELTDSAAAVLPEVTQPNADRYEQLSVQIRQLPPELAEVLVLRDVRGYSLERIAEIYQLRSDVLAARLFAAHEMLAAQTRKGAPLSGRPPLGGTDTSAAHPEIRLLFHAYLDSSLTDAESDQIRKHLKSCGSCREALTGLEWINAYLQELPDIDPPHWLAAAIMQRVKSAPAKLQKVRTAPSALSLQLGVGALFIAVIGFSAYVLLHEPEPSPRPTPAGETALKPAGPPLQSPQSSTAAGVTTPPAMPFKTAGRPLAREGRAVSVPLPLPAPPAEAPALPVSAAVPAPAAAPVKNEAAGRRDSRERSPELAPDWGENSPSPGPQH